MATIQNLNFNPTSIANCGLWLDAADRSTVITSGTTVTQWNDKSGLGNNATAVGTITNPVSLNGLRVMNYLGAANTYFQGSNTNTGTTLSAFAVFIMNSSSSTAARVVSLAVNGQNDFQNNLYTAAILRRTSLLGAYRNNAEMGNIAYTFGTACVFSSVYNGTNNTVFLNGTPGTTVATTGSFGYSNYLIGTSSTEESTMLYNGVIGEIILYNAGLNAVQRQNVEGYLAWKWGLQGSLPTTHPYYNIAPNSAGLSFPMSIPGPIQRQSFLPNSNALVFFNPGSISNMQLWLDAADINGNLTQYSNGQTVSTWRDKSGNGRNMLAITAGTGSITYSTYGGIGSVLFNNNSTNTAYMRVNSAVNLTNITVFAVARCRNQLANQVALIGISQSGFPYDSTDGFAQYIDCPQGTNYQDRFYGSGLANTVANIYTPGVDAYPLRMNSWTNTAAGVLSSWFNGNTGNTNASGSSRTSTATGFGIGFESSGSGGTPGNLRSISQFSEFLVFNSILSTAQRQQVEGYLAWKWGLQASLPSNHPFRNMVPGLTVNVRIPVLSMQTSTFSPRNVSGNTLWLDSQDPLGTGTAPFLNSKISTWVDKSGGGRNATQSTGSNQPTYSGNSITFSSASTTVLNMSDAYNMLNSSGRTYTFFVVERRGASSPTQFIFSGSIVNNAIFFGYNDNTTVTQTTASVSDTLYTVPGWANPDPIRIWGGGYNGTIRNIVLNGTIVSEGNYTGGPIASWASPVLGFIALGINTYYTGVMYEILFYNSFLTTVQRQNVEGYLAWKWGLVGNLPNNHPFKRCPPPPN